MSAELRPVVAVSLRATTVRGTAAAVSSQAVKFVLYFGVGIVLSRLLTPADFGLFGIGLAIAGLVEFARDGGLVVPVVQQQALSTDQRNALFWYNSAVGALLALLVLLAAPVAVRVYGEPRLFAIIGVLAVVFVFAGVSTQHLALLRRQMRFTTLAVAELTALSIASVVAIASALQSRSYWSLVWFQVAREVVQAVLIMGMARWTPRWPREWTTVMPLVRKGRIMMAFEVLGMLAFKFDNLVVGWFLGPTSLGFYDKAYQFLLLPVNQVNLPLSSVVHASLSRLQHEPERFRAFVVRALQLSTALGLPLTAFLFVNARTVVLQLPGAQWLDAVPVFRALAPAAWLLSISAASGWIFLALGRASRQLPFAAVTTLLTVLAFFIGVHWGTVGVAAAFSITRVALFVPTMMFTCAGTPVRWTDIITTAIRPAVASTVAMLSSVALDAVLPLSAWTLPLNALAFALLYATVWTVLPGGRALLIENVTQLRLLFRQRASDA